MAGIEREIKALLIAAGLWACVTACGPTVVDLGARGGGGLAEPSAGAGGLVQAGGTGGASGSAGLGSGAGAGSVAVAMSGTGAAPSVDDAGAAPSPDGGAVATGPDRSSGCGLQPPASDTSISINGASTSYLVDLATSYDPNTPYPLVFSFRGANTTAAAFRRYLELPTVVGADGIVVNVDCANGAATWDLQRDRMVFEALLAKLEASYCIDQRRVFVVGHATGAIFASVLACRYGKVLRGLGSLNGVAPMEMCTGELAVWISQGNGDVTRMLGRDSRDFWVNHNQCDASMTAPVDPSPCLEYLGCEQAAPVRYCEYDGGIDLPPFAATGVWSFLKGL
jgi:predicted esterase